MPAISDRIEFAPPPQPGRAPAFILAVLAHLLLMAALTWGIHWNRESENAAVEAELWSSVPQQAAPRLVEPPPPAPAPEPPRRVETPPPPPAPREADIAIEREKRASERKRLHEEELERQKKLEARRKQEELKREQLAEQKAEQKAAEDKRKKEEQAKAKKLREEEARLAKMRDDNIKRMQGLAGATGGPTSTGAVQHSAGPSASYAGKIQARVRPNIVYTDDTSGNISTEVEVRMAPDGTITARKVVKPSNVKAWDDAVLRALDKTEVLPRDEDGRVPPSLIITFRPAK